MNIKKASITLRMFQLKIDRAKFILTTSPLINNVNILKYIENVNKDFKYSSQLKKYQKEQKQQYFVLNQKNHQHKVPSILKQLFSNNNTEYSLCNTTRKAIFNIYNNSTAITQYITIASYNNQFQKLYQRPHHIKASLMITTQTAIQLLVYNLMICQKNLNFHCVRYRNNTRKLLQYSDSDFFIFKVESCINLFCNFIIKFINNINLFENYFSFNLNIVLNGSDNDINSIQKFNKDLATIILSESNNNNNIENRFYSANKFGANFISKCLKFKNFLKGDNTTNIFNINKKMSKVATEQPPIDISKGNTSKNDSITKELSNCGNPSAVGGSEISSSSSSSSSGNEKNTLNNIEKHGKESCFKSNLGDIIQFLELVGGLKHTKRTGFVLRDVKNCESISGHMYRMAMMTFLLDGTEGLNQTKCMELALVHDLAECIVGDLTPFCGVTKEEKKRMEMDAMEKICKLIEPRGKRMWELFVEYEGGESPESKFVKDLDRLDMVLQAFEYEKRDNCLMKHQEFFDSTEGKFEHNFVQKLVNEIYDQRNQLAKEHGCTPNMYPPGDFLQNGHQNNNTQNQNDSIVVNGDVQSSSSAELSSSPSTSSLASTSKSTVPSTVDLDQKKATNGR